jgi:site-specific DNA-methyltransferase (adenine-specific)
MTRLFDQMLNSVVNGDCIDVMSAMPWASVDFILTDPPYLVNYRDRSGRSIANDDNDAWVKPAFRQMYRVLRPHSLCVSFYAWNRVDTFMAAWREAGFSIVGHIVFRKSYGSNARFLSYRHESAYLLAKGRPCLPAAPVPDVLDFPYSGNKLHPTQKPVQPLKTLIGAFTKPGGVVCDPFCGSGSTLVAARELGRQFIGIELDPDHHRTATKRLSGLIRESVSIAA